MSGYLHFYATHPALQKLAETLNDAGHAFHHTMDWQDPHEWNEGKKSYCELIQEAFAAVDAALVPSGGAQQ